ncbi:hypothetical protein ACFL6B_01605 [Thermodesulfobacteriota bacterium]
MNKNGLHLTSEQFVQIKINDIKENSNKLEFNEELENEDLLLLLDTIYDIIEDAITLSRFLSSNVCEVKTSL